jgi:hypothetical protein
VTAISSGSIVGNRLETIENREDRAEGRWLDEVLGKARLE